MSSVDYFERKLDDKPESMHSLIACRKFVLPVLFSPMTHVVVSEIGTSKCSNDRKFRTTTRLSRIADAPAFPKVICVTIGAVMTPRRVNFRYSRSAMEFLYNFSVFSIASEGTYQPQSYPSRGGYPNAVQKTR